LNPLLQSVAERLSVDDINGAWRAIQGHAASTPTGPLLASIAEAAEAKWHPPLPEIAQRAAASAQDPQAIGALGSALVSVGEARLAADLLGRAVALDPSDSPLLAERVAALELTGDHAAALLAITQAPSAARASATVAYLHAFHLLLDGRIDQAADVDIPEGPQADFLRERLRARIARARALGLSDPRARIAAIAGTLALHVSPVPVHEGPTQSAARIAELSAALRGLDLRPDRVAYLATPGADRLAARIADHLGLPCELYQGASSDLALLVVVDLADISPDRASDLRSREGLALYAHLASSAREHAIAPDLLGTYAPAVTLGAASRAGVDRAAGTDLHGTSAPGGTDQDASQTGTEPPGLFGSDDDDDDALFAEPLPAIPTVADDAFAVTWASAPAPAGPRTLPRDRLWAGLIV